MKNKYFITVLVILVVTATGYYLSRPRLKPLPTKDNPSPSGLYTEVPPFEQWEWVEKGDDEGNIIYIIKLPKLDKWVEGLGSARINHILLSVSLGDKYGYTDIMDYIDQHEDKFTRRFVESLGFQHIGPFYSYKEYSYVSEGAIINYILTKKYIISIAYDSERKCLSKLNVRDDDKLQKCREYYQIYLPIVEKALSTLEIPDYVDDRGFATSSEVKLLPDELRIYEVR